MIALAALLLLTGSPPRDLLQDTLPRPVPEERRIEPGTDSARSTANMLRGQMVSLDSLLGPPSRPPHLFARLGRGTGDCYNPTDSIVAVSNARRWPPKTTSSYAVFTDSLHRVRVVVETPTSCSGDWTISYTHYFDDAGQTIAFTRYSGFFNGCDFGLARESTTYGYAHGSLVFKDYLLTDGPGHPKRTSACAFMYRQPYSIFRTWTAYARAFRSRSHH